MNAKEHYKDVELVNKEIEDVNRVVDRIIADNERMKKEDGHDMDDRFIIEEVMVEEIADYIEEGKSIMLPLNLLVEVRKALIKEGYEIIH